MERPDALTTTDDDLVLPNVTLDENGALIEDNHVEVEDPDGRAPLAPALPGEDEEEAEIEVLLGDDDEEGGRKSAKGDDDEDEFEDVEPDQEFAQTWASQEQQARINQAEARAIMAEAESQAQVAAANRAQVSLGLETVEQRRSLYQEAYNEAVQDEDILRAQQIQQQLASLDQIEQELRHASTQIPDPDQIRQYGQQQAYARMVQRPSGKNVGAGVTTTNKLAERWSSANEWMRSDGNRQANQFVIHQSQQMVQSGWNPDDPGFYAELSKRVKSAYPGLPVKALKAKKGPPKRQARGPVAPGRSRSGTPSRSRPASNSNRYTLSKADVAAMRRMALDPGNAEHRTYFAKSRMESNAGG